MSASAVAVSGARRWMPWLLLVAGMLWIWRDTAAGMVSIWMRSETFTHAFLVPPIALWLAWRRRTLLLATPTRPVPWLLVPIAAACFVWLLGQLAAVAVASQFALVTLIILSVPAVFGWALARQLAFPLLFLYFAVPFGEFMVPQLMAWTADFTVLALRATGVPVYREGLEFVIPSGHWSVVEACSGVRYLIASFMVGTLFAYLNYRSTLRRAVFIAAALLVPILANWFRAYMIVMIGHLSGNELAVGVDHLIYGWVFFGLVIGLMFYIGSRWSEPDETLVPPPQAGATAHRSGWAVAVAVAVLVAGTQAWVWRSDHEAPTTPGLAMPAAPAGWAAAEAPLPWPPEFPDPSATASTAQDRDGHRVWLWAAYYRQQTDGRKLVSSVNGLVAGGEGAPWHQISAGGRPAEAAVPAVRTATIRSGLGADLRAGLRLRVWHLYWVGGRWTTSDVRAKVWQAIDRLMGRGDDGAVVVLATPLATQETGDADAVLETFARAQFGAIDAALRAARDTR